MSYRYRHDRGPDARIASVANPLELLFEWESISFMGSKTMKRRKDWPPRSLILSKKIYLRVNPGQYPCLIHMLLASNMITLGPEKDETIENLGGLEGG